MVGSFWQRGIDPSRIHEDDIEKALSQFCAPPAFDKKTGSQPSISDSTFKRIAELLDHLQAHQHVRGWSDRPRTYTVLRNINRLSLFPRFIKLGLNDISFPYTIDKIPDLIHDDGLKDEFLKHQKYILTNASQLEDGQHALTKDGDDIFRLVRHLGRGGFGSVDQVLSRLSFREFARKKFLRKTSSKADQTVLRSFENELTNLKKLSHEHLVKVVGSNTDQRGVAFLMEPVADMNLLHFLENFSQERDRLSPSLRSYFGCLANAVGYLHTQRIRHRDLKPANILVKDLKIYIADFGTARDWSNALHDTTTDSNVPTTAAYVAPEVAHRSPRNSAADMWSLGVVYLEMVTVLQGYSLPTMRRFIETRGTKHPYLYGNGPATTQWFEELRLNGQGPKSDNEPLTWIKDLTQVEPQRRPKPWALTDQIRSSISSTAFIGICCADEDEICDYPSPPSTVASEEEGTLQEQLGAFGLFERPHGSLMQPQKQSRLEKWRRDVLSETASPYATSLCGDVVGEPYEITEDESIEAKEFTSIQPDLEIEGSKDHTIIESCYGYIIAEDDPDDEKGIEANGYEITEDSSGSRKRLDAVPEFPDSPEPIPSATATIAAVTQLGPGATSDRTKITKPKGIATFNDDPKLADGEALTADNLSRLASSTIDPSINTPNGSRRTQRAYETKPKMTAGFYMQEVWEAASTIQTSVLDAKTIKVFAGLGPGIIWQDRTQHLVESYTKQGKASAVRELLRAGCNPGTRKKPRWKPLISAVRAGTLRHHKVVKVLLNHGADANARHPATGKTALHFAIENPFFQGYTNIIRDLLEHGADPNALDKNKDSPLLQILYGGYKPLEKHKRDALACLLQDHVDVDVNVRSLGTLDMPIHLAVRRRDAIAVAILIHRGSQVNVPNSTGLTPLRIAASTWSETCSEDDIEILKYLFLGGANVTGEAEHTVLEMAARQGCVQAVRLLLSNKDGAQTSSGRTQNILPNAYQAAAEAATANKSRMSEASYTAIMEALEITPA
ncbi:MAG: hypothetical protein Q9213_001640 [Squamulea squamosa]